MNEERILNEENEQFVAVFFQAVAGMSDETKSQMVGMAQGIKYGVQEK